MRLNQKLAPTFFAKFVQTCPPFWLKRISPTTKDKRFAKANMDAVQLQFWLQGLDKLKGRGATFILLKAKVLARVINDLVDSSFTPKESGGGKNPGNFGDFLGDFLEVIKNGKFQRYRRFWNKSTKLG